MAGRGEIVTVPVDRLARPVLAYAARLPVVTEDAAALAAQGRVLLERFENEALRHGLSPQAAMAARGALALLLQDAGTANPALAGWQSAAQCAALQQGGGLARLDALLREPAQTRKAALEAAVFRGLTTLVPTAVGDAAMLQKFEYELGGNTPAHIRDALRLDEGGMMPGGFLDALGNSLGLVEMMTALPVAVIQKSDSAGIADALQTHVCFDDRDATLNDALGSAGVDLRVRVLLINS